MNFIKIKLVMNVLKNINLENKIDDLTLCWCSSFILNKIKVIDYLNIVKDIVIVNRHESEASERYLSGILYYLNNHIMTSINNIDSSKKYDCWKVNLYDSFPGIYFVKRVQQKNERTIDHETIIDNKEKRTIDESLFSRNILSTIIYHKNNSIN